MRHPEGGLILPKRDSSVWTLKPYTPNLSPTAQFKKSSPKIAQAKAPNPTFCETNS